jgi:hypothetical protein
VSSFRRIAPWLLLGPITGPLAAGMYRNIRRDEHILACLYGLALAVAWFDMMQFGNRLIHILHGLVPRL